MGASKKVKPVSIEIPVPDEGRDFQGGNFLNALDDLCCYFMTKRNFDLEEMAESLKLYIKTLENYV